MMICGREEAAGCDWRWVAIGERWGKGVELKGGSGTELGWEGRLAHTVAIDGTVVR